MSEIALVSSRKFKLDNLAKKGNTGARRALELANQPNRFLSTVQIGITLIGILTGIFSGDEITERLRVALEGMPALAPYAGSLSVIIVVIIITFLSIVFGELVPKRIGLIYPESIAIAMSGPMTLVSKIAAPFIWLLTKTNDLVLRVFGIKSDTENTVTEEEIKAMVQDSTESGEIQEIEQDIVERVFALGDRRISELMTHRSDIIWFNISDDLDDIRQKVKQETHSIYPVAKDQLDELVGIVSIKDLFPQELERNTFKLADHIKKPIYVHDNTPAYKALDKFKENKTHYAVVVDEYGSVQGIVSMDDILDALLGDVSENAHEEYQIIQRNDNSWLADGQYPYFEFLNYFDLTEEEEDDEAGDFNTIAGLVLNKVGRIPETGEKVTWRHYEIEVVDMDGLRIDKVLITKTED